MFETSRGQASLGGRLNLYYQESKFGTISNDSWNQDLNLTVRDDLFVKNQLALSYLVERKTGSMLEKAFLRHRIRTVITGTPYVFSAEYTPSYSIMGTPGEKARRQRYLFGVSPAKYPTFNVTYENSDRYGGSGASRIDKKAENKLAAASYSYRLAAVRGSFRERSNSDRYTSENRRQVTEGTGEVSLEQGLGRLGSVMTSYNGFFSEEDIAGGGGADVRIDNVRGLVGLHFTDFVSLSASYLGNSIRRTEADITKSSSQELYSSLSVTPTDYLNVQLSRNIRESEDEGVRAYSDYLRAQGTIQGYVRANMRGRASIQRTFILRSKEGAFPSNGYFFNLDTDLMPGLQALFDLNILLSENPNVRTQRYQIRKSVDLRGYMRPDLTMNFSLRSLTYGDRLDLFSASTHDVELDLNYRPKPKFSTIFTITRSVDKRPQGGDGLYLSSTSTFNLSGGTHLSFIYIRRDVNGTVLATQGTSASATYPNNYLLELVLVLSRDSRLSVKYDIRDLSQGGISSVLGATFIKRF